MKKSLLITAALTAVILTSAVKTAHADYGCSGQYGQYGGCPTSQSIMIDKTVGKVTEGSTTLEYVDNLSASDRKFKGGEFINFQLKVKNTSGATQTNVRVTDYVPSYLDPVEGPGEYDANERTITFYIPELKSNEEKIYGVKMQVKPQAQINTMTDGACVLNKAFAAVDKAYDEDT
ncbi:MAG: hypothetical protein ABIO02_01380, partial [Patescibacteria group bacterium]